MTNEASFWLGVAASIAVTTMGALQQIFAGNPSTPTRTRLARIGMLILGCALIIAILAAVFRPTIPSAVEAQPAFPTAMPSTTSESPSEPLNVQTAVEPDKGQPEPLAEGSVEPSPTPKSVGTIEDASLRAPAMPPPAGVAFVKLTRGTVSVYPICTGNACAYQNLRYVAAPRYRIENTGSDVVYAAVLANSASVGDCNGGFEASKGLTAIYSTNTFDPEMFSLIRPHATVDVTTAVNGTCVLSLLDARATDITITLLVSDGRRVVPLPLSLNDASVKVRREEY